MRLTAAAAKRTLLGEVSQDTNTAERLLRIEIGQLAIDGMGLDDFRLGGNNIDPSAHGFSPSFFVKPTRPKEAASQNSVCIHFANG